MYDSPLRRMFALVVLVVIAWPAVALAASWDTSFSKEAVAERIDADHKRFLIAAADGKQASKKAATALASALRSAPVELVLREDVSGDEQTSDQKIVDRFSSKPIDRVILVRTFGGDKSKPPRAVVTIYKRDGTSLTGFSVRRGAALGAAEATSESTESTEGETDPTREQSAQEDEQPAEGAPTDDDNEASKGVSKKAAERISEVTNQTQKNRREAVKTFKRKFLWFEEIVTVNANSGNVANRYTQAYRGEYKEPVPGKKFYKIVDRDDLATKYGRRKTTKVGLTVGGVVGMIGGSALMFGTIGNPTSETQLTDVCDENDDAFIDQPSEEECVERRKRRNKRKNTTLLVSGGTIAGLSYIGFMVGLFMTPHPVSASQRRKLADRYNERLKERLGLSSNVSAPIPGSSSKQKLQYDLDLHFGPSRTGASLNFRF